MAIRVKGAYLRREMILDFFLTPFVSLNTKHGDCAQDCIGTFHGSWLQHGSISKQVNAGCTKHICGVGQRPVARVPTVTRAPHGAVRSSPHHAQKFSRSDTPARAFIQYDGLILPAPG
jgi:hypothetical protein